MNPEKAHAPAPPPIAPTPDAITLDIDDPAKWQMKVRLYLERLSEEEGGKWMDDYRMIGTMAARVVRGQLYKRVTNRCVICDKPFKDGRPAGEAGWSDADNEYIKVYVCDQSEWPRLMEYIYDKEQGVIKANERAEKAAAKAATDARSASLARSARA